MFKSFCIKTNNNRIVDYLLNNFENVDLENLYVSKLKFKYYNNFIVHYKGKSLDSFYSTFSKILASTIIEFYEKNIIKHIINSNYFYFTDIEQKKIFDIVIDYIYNNKLTESYIRKDSIIISCIEYFSINKSAILDGFVNFRINDYIKIIMIGITGLGLTELGMFIGVDFIGIYYLWSKIVVTAIVFLWNYWARKVFVF